MKTRIIQNWKSTLIGLCLLLLSATLLWLKEITFTEFTAFLPTVLGLMYVRDEGFWEKDGKR
ncbi:MAG: hypothetical protein WCR01_14385 [Bacteroidota bacterium]